ncbi:MAG: cation:proton antiporter [Planctomycetota bacterium]|nr:cation:proton antiporter [Planctomycetota bacterium]
MEFHTLLFSSGDSSTLVTVAAVVVLAIGAQWVAWRARIPAILLLLSIGFFAGPVTGFLQPDHLIGEELLFPIVSLAVALILFEGGLSLHLGDLHESGGVIRNLCTLGAVLTGLLTALAAFYLLDVGFAVSLILGCMLVVTGPTVIGPLIRHIRPADRVGTIAKWEGIVIDPVGATLGILALASVEAVELGTAGPMTAVVFGLIKTIVYGGSIGVAAAATALFCMRRYWIPDHLQSPVLLMLVVACFTLANVLQAEAGLFAVTLMGVVMVNQKSVSLKHIIEFKENLRILLISLLFIVLAARIQLATLDELGWRSVMFVAALMLVIRPAAVLVSTIKSGLTWQERLFLSWLAPRGIVAAALASVFAIALQELEKGLQHEPVLLQPGAAAKLEPVTFLVIIVTVSIYGLTAGPLAKRLGLSAANPQGVLFASAHPAARAIAKAVQETGFPVLMVDINRHNVNVARMEQLPAVHASILSEPVMEELDLAGVGRLLALTRNDEINALAAFRFLEVFGRSEVYRLRAASVGPSRTETAGEVLHGRRLFSDDATYSYLDERFDAGAVVKRTKLTPEFDYGAFRELYGQSALVLFTVTATGNLMVNTGDQPLAPGPGDTVIAVVDADNDNTPA